MSLLRAALIALALVAAAVLGTLHAQEPAALLRVASGTENFRAAPGGARLAVVGADARLPSSQAQGNWRGVTLAGWVPAAAVQTTQRDGFSLIVSRGGAELSAAAEGTSIARLDAGMLLHERERRGEWVRVERAGWMWGASLTAAPAAATATPPSSAPAAAAPPPPPAPGQVVVHRAPGGDSLAVMVGGGPLEVLGREGEWTRVRIEGWVRGNPREGPAAGPLRDLTVPALRDDPDRFRGREIVLPLQFVSLERATAIRSDFAEGENYALMRSAAGGAGFVYVAVTPEQVAAFSRFSPLQRLEVVGRVRTGRSAQMGHPVLELISLRPL